MPVEDFFPPPASLKARKIGEKQAQMEPRTQQNIYKEGNPRDMEKNEGIMSVFNDLQPIQPSHNICYRSKCEGEQGKYGHWALTLSVLELSCYSIILVVIGLHNLAYFDIF